MITVLAFIHVKPGSRSAFLEAFRANVPNVLGEAGCIEYYPAVDAPADLPPQKLDENLVTIIEKWESLDALRTHLAAPHMSVYREKVKDIVAGVDLKVLQEA